MAETIFALSRFLQLKLILCMHFLEKKNDLQKWAWKYLIADKIEFDMKAVHERNALRSHQIPQVFMMLAEASRHIEY